MSKGLKTFLWVDGQRPRPDTLSGWLEWLVGLAISRAILLLNGTKEEGETWTDADLLAATAGLQARGMKAVWMWWATSTRAAIDEQIDDLDKLFTMGARPDGLQWDCEEHWGRAGVDLAGHLSDRILWLLNKHGCSHLPQVASAQGLHYVEVSITAIVGKWKDKTMRAQDAAVCQTDAFTAGYTQAYLFFNPKPGHWSRNLPRQPGAIQRGTWEAWHKMLDDEYHDEPMAGLYNGLDLIYMGNAAHLQRIPGVSGLDGMRWGVEACQVLESTHPDTFAGGGWWSGKHVKGNDSKARIIQAAAGSGHIGATPLPPSTPFDLARAMTFNAQRDHWEGIPDQALERWPGLRDHHTSDAFAQAAAAYQQAHGLTIDGKLGTGTLGHMTELFGPKQSPMLAFMDAVCAVQGSSARMFRPSGVTITDDDMNADDWRVA